MARRPRSGGGGGGGGTTGSADSLPVFFATNRARLADAFDKDAAAGAEGQRRLWLGEVAVELLGRPDATEAPRELLSRPKVIGEDDFADPAGGSAAGVLDAWLAAAKANRAVPLFFVHGFANSFDDAVRRAAQLHEFYGAAGARLCPLVFSWPSNGRLVDIQGLLAGRGGALDEYRADQRDAAASGVALARLLREVERAAARAGDPRMVLLAHSMGNWALANGLAVLANGLLTRDMRDLFEQAVLMAPDVSGTAFAPGRPLHDLPRLAAQVTVGISVDPVLEFSGQAADGDRRLGHFGPRDLATLPGRVLVVDYFRGMESEAAKQALIESAAGATSFDLVGHQYYRNDRNVRGDLALVFNGAKPRDLADRVAVSPDTPFGGGRRRHAELRFRG